MGCGGSESVLWLLQLTPKIGGMSRKYGWREQQQQQPTTRRAKMERRGEREKREGEEERPAPVKLEKEESSFIWPSE